MLRQDKFWIGIIMGLLFPLMFFIIFMEINNLLIEKVFKGGEGLRLQFRFVLSICMNIIPFTIYNRAKKYHAMRGVLLSTFVLAFIFVIFFFKAIFSD